MFWEAARASLTAVEVNGRNLQSYCATNARERLFTPFKRPSWGFKHWEMVGRLETQGPGWASCNLSCSDTDHGAVCVCCLHNKLAVIYISMKALYGCGSSSLLCLVVKSLTTSFHSLLVC